MAFSVYPGIVLKAKERGLSREIALWHIVRNLRDCGWIPLEDLRAFAHTNGLCSARTLRRWLRHGEGKLWSVNQFTKRLEYRSLARVARGLGCDPGKPVEGALSDFRGNGGRLRDLALAGILEARGEKPISMAAIEEITGINSRAQQRLRKRRGVKATPNIGSRSYDGDVVGEGRWFWKGKLYQRLPNSYRTPVKLLPLGQVRKVRKLLRGDGVLEGTLISRRYFQTDVAAHRCKRRAEQAWIATGKRLGKARLWEASATC